MLDHQDILKSFTEEEKQLIIDHDDAKQCVQDAKKTLERAKLEGKPHEEIGRLYVNYWKADRDRAIKSQALIYHFSNFQIGLIRQMESTLRIELERRTDDAENELSEKVM